MTTINTKHLRELAEKATPGSWTAHTWSHQFDEDITHGYVSANGVELWDTSGGNCVAAAHDAVYIAAANPQAMLAILDELERFEKDYPCDGGCSYGDGPQEECSRHGRNPSDLWGIIENLIKQRDERQARIDAALEVHGDISLSDTDALFGMKNALSTPTENGEEQ